MFKRKTEKIKFKPIFHGSIARKIFFLSIFVLSQIIFLTSSSFLLNSIEIKGLDKIDGKDVEEHCKPPFGHLIWFTNTDLMNEKILSIPWIKKSKIKKIYPNKLSVSLSERTLVLAEANEKNPNKWYGIDSDGYILTEIDSKKINNFPKIVTNEEVILHSKVNKIHIKSILLVNSLISKENKKNIRYYKIDEGGYISFIYDTGKRTFEVKIGEAENASDKMKIFDAMKDQMGNQINYLEYIDLRYSEPVVKLRGTIRK
ncbi:FtsQ-type POTRA domain-containing protein [bacterium]|nr:FtsQ-type POTRA domain-containing protein [bacterium]